MQAGISRERGRSCNQFEERRTRASGECRPARSLGTSNEPSRSPLLSSRLIYSESLTRATGLYCALRTMTPSRGIDVMHVPHASRYRRRGGAGVSDRVRTIDEVVVVAARAFAMAACSRSSEPPPPAPAAAPASPAGAPSPAAAPGLESAHAPRIAATGAASPHGGSADGSPHGMLTWDTPAAWTQEKPANPMRMAQYRVPASGGDSQDGECVVFYFGPGQGGDASSNVARWVSMFSTPSGGPVEGKVTEQKVGERMVTRIEAAGTYQPTAMMGGAPPPKQPGSMLLGAIVPGADANWFFRCVGPEKTMAASRPSFDGFIASVR